MADGYLCRACSKVVSATKNDRYRTHKNAEGVNCEMSSVEIPDDLLQQPPSDTKNAGVPEEGKDFAKCPQCGRNVKLTRLGYFPPHDTTLYGGEQCSTTGVRAFHAGKGNDLPLPGDTIPERGVDRAVRPKVSNELELHRERIGKSMKELEAAPVPAGTAPATATPTAEGAVPAPGDASEQNLIRQPMEITEDLWAGMEILPAEYVPEAATSGASTETSSPASATTSTPSPPPSIEPVSTGPFALGIRHSELIRQPDSPFLQPPEYAGPEKPEPMGDLAKELSIRIKETFYAYDNRKTKDNRSAQTTLGPSEIGTPCDRRLAMALMGTPPVNPGGDGWAAFVGTCGHVGMAEMLQFADAGTGRFAVEMPLAFPSVHVPRGTSDALDRRDATVIDWKFMGAYSLKKFKLEGPSDAYRIQAHTYGLGYVLAGEVVKNVAVVGLPRAGDSLDDMHVWTEKFDRKVAEAALKRVEDIAARAGVPTPNRPRMTAAAEFPTANDCRYCPFHLKNDKEMRRGCPGV